MFSGLAAFLSAIVGWITATVAPFALLISAVLILLVLPTFLSSYLPSFLVLALIIVLFFNAVRLIINR